MKRHLILISIGILLFGCAKTSQKTEEDATLTNEHLIQLTTEQLAQAGIKTGNIEQKDINSTLKVNGIIDVPPQNMVSVSIPLGGYLKYTKLLPGMHFSKGEVIAVMEDLQYIQLQQEYLSVKAQLGYQQPEFERQQELNAQKAASDKVFQQSQAALNELLIKKNALKEKLKLIGINVEKLTPDNISRTINITAPIDGFVSNVNVNIGKYVNPTDVLFELVNPDDIHLNLNIFEKDLSKLHVGQTLHAYTNFNNKKYKCTILLIGKDISADRSTSVHCHFDQYDKTLLPGTYMNADIDLVQTKTTVLPTDAVVNHNGKNYVFVEHNTGSYQMTEVEIGITTNEFKEIKNNAVTQLKGKKIVTQGAYNLLMQFANKDE